MRTFIGTIVAIATLAAPAWAERGESIHQAEIDEAYTLIFQTSLGRAICRQILGADAAAIQFHLGVSAATARRISRTCPRVSRHRWIFSTEPTDIRKLTLTNEQPRKYKVLVSNISFPIESWTEPFTNTTVLVTQKLPLPRERWVQILAHELAVYFDSKANPAHPDAEKIPELKNLRFTTTHTLNPLMAASNPLQGHAFTFVRALLVEANIVNELIRLQKIKGPPTLDFEQLRIIDESCTHECLQDLVLRVRETLLPIALPLLAYAPQYRSMILAEIPRLYLDWDTEVVSRARLVLNRLPVDFLQSRFPPDPVNDMKKVFYANLEQYKKSAEVGQFLVNDLWPLEEKSLFESRLSERGESLLEFLKRPLLSGYNVGLSSGPRVRIRTGVTE